VFEQRHCASFVMRMMLQMVQAPKRATTDFTPALLLRFFCGRQDVESSMGEHNSSRRAFSAERTREKPVMNEKAAMFCSIMTILHAKMGAASKTEGCWTTGSSATTSGVPPTLWCNTFEEGVFEESLPARFFRRGRDNRNVHTGGGEEGERAMQQGEHRGIKATEFADGGSDPRGVTFTHYKCAPEEHNIRCSFTKLIRKTNPPHEAQTELRILDSRFKIRDQQCHSKKGEKFMAHAEHLCFFLHYLPEWK